MQKTKKFPSATKFPSEDRFARYAFCKPGRTAGLLREFLPPKLLRCLDLDQLAVLPDQIISKDLKERRDDLNMQCPLVNGGKVIVRILIEHKSGFDPGLWMQLVRSILASWEKSGISAVIPVVLHTGPEPFRFETPKLRLKQLPQPVAEILPHLGVQAIDLASTSEARIWQSKHLDNSAKVALAILKLAQLKSLTLGKIRTVLLTEMPEETVEERAKLLDAAINYLQYKSERLKPQISKLRSDMALAHPINPKSAFAQELREAKAQGISQGLREGLERAKLEDVNRLLAKGCDWVFIHDVCQIDEAAYKQLQTKYPGHITR